LRLAEGATGDCEAIAELDRQEFNLRSVLFTKSFAQQSTRRPLSFALCLRHNRESSQRTAGVRTANVESDQMVVEPTADVASDHRRSCARQGSQEAAIGPTISTFICPAASKVMEEVEEISKGIADLELAQT
jgi:hypothetical protein